jgi:hypothetical protein
LNRDRRDRVNHHLAADQLLPSHTVVDSVKPGMSSYPFAGRQWNLFVAEHEPLRNLVADRQCGGARRQQCHPSQQDQYNAGYPRACATLLHYFLRVTHSRINLA